MKKQKLLAFAAAGFVACGCVFDVSATTFTLTDNNAKVTFSSQNNFGMKNWYTDGVDHLFQQQFFYRVGSTGYERTINALDLLDVRKTANNALSVVYGTAGLEIEVSYLLSGGDAGSGYSTINEQIRISNLSNQSIDFHFFQYVDFDLAEAGLGDYLNLIQNVEGLFTGAVQRKGNSYFAEEVVSPGANRAQADEVYPTWPLVDSLYDYEPTTLNNNSGPVSGDAAWAFQWDKCIEANGCFEISILKSVYTTPVPEPSVLAMVSLVGAVLVARKRLKN